MRPASIVTFDRLYLVAIGLGLINSVLSLPHAEQVLADNPAMQQLRLGAVTLYVLLALTVAIQLGLWHFVAHRGSSLARWLLIAVTALGLLNLPMALRQLGQGAGLGILLTVAIEAMRIVAIGFLFRADARPWFVGAARRTDAAD